MMKQVRAEILGITLNREEHEDSNGKMRLYWVLRDENGHIDIMVKKWEDMLHELMWHTVEQRRI